MPSALRRLFQSGARLLPLLLLAASLQPLAATPIADLAGRTSELSAHIQFPTTLVLVVDSEADLREAQRLLTLAQSQNQRCLILVSLPTGNLIQSSAIRRAAKRFFDSDFSRSRVFLVESDQLPHPPARAFLFAPDSPDPLWLSDSLPQTLPSLSR